MDKTIKQQEQNQAFEIFMETRNFCPVFLEKKSVITVHVNNFSMTLFLQQSYHLRDTLDHMGGRKLRELGDFEWRRCIRFYHHTKGRILPKSLVFDKFGPHNSSKVNLS